MSKDIKEHYEDLVKLHNSLNPDNIEELMERVQWTNKQSTK